MSQDQKHVQYLKANGRYREEVDRYHTLDLILQEGPPGLRRRLAASRHVFANAGFADIDSQFQQFAMDARRTPQRIIMAHLANQFLRFVRNRRTSHWAVPNLPRPKQPKPLAVPADHRLWPDDYEGGSPTTPKPGQVCPEEAIGASQPRSFY